MSFQHYPLGAVTTHLGSGISRPFFDTPTGRPVLRSNNVSGGNIVCNDIKYWHEIDPRGANLDSVSPVCGDILVNFVNGSSKELGKAAMYQGKPEGCIVTTNFFIVRFDRTRVLPEFANYYFQSDFYREWLFVNAGFSGQGSFNKADFSRLSFPCPTLKEQRRIVDVLQAWDEAIEKLGTLIDTRQRQHQAIVNQLVFAKLRFPSFGKSEPRKEYRWFDIPPDWNVCPIGSLAKEISERNGDVDEGEVLSCTKYEGFVRSLEYFKKQVYSGDLSGYKKIWHGDFGFPSNHIEEGSIGLQNLVEVGIVSPIYTVFRFDPERIDNAFAHGVLKTSVYRHIFEVSTSASVDRRGSLRWKEFAKIPFPVPSIEEQRAISGVIAANNELIDRLERELSALKRQKRGLMQKLLTGTWQVKC